MPDEPTTTTTPVPEDRDYDVETAAPEVEAPRRAASAQFVVDSQVGAQAAMREALDPAHQSLAEALRLSYRVLQVVMVILIVLFAFSGVQTVREDESGVMLRWGEIQAVNGQAALTPGPHVSLWPYPAGEFVIVGSKGRTANPGTAYWPGIRQGQSLEDMIENAQANMHLRPTRDGYILTAGGDIGHILVAADYEVASVVDFVSRVADADPSRSADQVVRLALQRAIVHESARMTLQEIVDINDASRARLLETTQAFLDDLECGVHVGSVRTPDSRAALAIERIFREEQSARVDAEKTVIAAHNEAEELLTEVAGSNWRELLEIIRDYEDAELEGDDELAAERLVQIDAWMRDETKVSGEIASTLRRAESYASQVELTLGSDAALFEGLLAAYRQNPELTIASLWLDSYTSVLRHPTAEVMRVPGNVAMMRFAIEGSTAVQEARTNQRLRDRERETMTGVIGNIRRDQRREDVRDGPGRILDVEGGRIRSNEGG